MRLHVSLLGRSQSEFFYTLIFRSLNDKPITSFDSILCFQDDDNINVKPSNFDISKKNFFCEKIFKIINFKQKLRHQVVEAEAIKVEVETIQKLTLPHPL